MFLRWVLPPDPSVIIDLIDLGDPKRLKIASRFAMELKFWYWKVSGISVATLIFMPWAYATFSHARDVEANVQRAMAPLQTQLTVLTNALYEQLASSTADRICVLVGTMTREEQPIEQRRLRAEIDKEQVKYRLYTNRDRDYPEGRCPGAT